MTHSKLPDGRVRFNYSWSLSKRLEESIRMVSEMARVGRGPKMSIPAGDRLELGGDEDIFICDALREAKELLDAAPVQPTGSLREALIKEVSPDSIDLYLSKIPWRKDANPILKEGLRGHIYHFAKTILEDLLACDFNGNPAQTVPRGTFDREAQQFIQENTPPAREEAVRAEP
jgi:hypothetical protein